MASPILWRRSFVAPESQTLTLSYSIHSEAHVVASSIAVFEKDTT